MDCRTCKYRSDIIHMGIPYCKKCYSEIIWRRIRKEVRFLKIGKYEDITVSGRLSQFFLRKIFSGSNKKITVSKDPLVQEWFIENTILVFFGEKDNKKIKLFSSCTEDEIIQFCRFNGVQYSKAIWPKSIIELGRLEKLYPGIKHGLVKSITGLEKS